MSKKLLQFIAGLLAFTAVIMIAVINHNHKSNQPEPVMQSGVVLNSK